MEEIDVIAALAALAQTQRLRVFRALVVAGPGGLTPSVMGEQLSVAANTLSFHLKELAHSGLVGVEPRGRNLIYRANFATMTALMAYLTEQCCQGAACEVTDPANTYANPCTMTNTTPQSAPAPINVLFLCTHNSARSILAEACLTHVGRGRFKGFSAGSSPRANQQPNPLALEALHNAGISTEGLSSKNWDAFALPDAPHMDLVITVCDNAAGEVCPYWPGQPATAHWGYADPSEGPGSDDQKREAFRQTLHAIHRRLELLVNLPASSVNKLMLQTSARHLDKA